MEKYNIYEMLADLELIRYTVDAKAEKQQEGDEHAAEIRKQIAALAANLERYFYDELRETATEAQFDELNGIYKKFSEEPPGEEKKRLGKQFTELVDEIEASGVTIGFQVTNGFFYPIK